VERSDPVGLGPKSGSMDGWMRRWVEREDEGSGVSAASAGRETVTCHSAANLV
jgi:hypothetical protein